jgi:hypothetical protein
MELRSLFRFRHSGAESLERSLHLSRQFCLCLAFAQDAQEFVLRSVAEARLGLETTVLKPPHHFGALFFII